MKRLEIVNVKANACQLWGNVSLISASELKTNILSHALGLKRIGLLHRMIICRLINETVAANLEKMQTFLFNQKRCSIQYVLLLVADSIMSKSVIKVLL